MYGCEERNTISQIETFRKGVERERERKRERKRERERERERKGLTMRKRVIKMRERD